MGGTQQENTSEGWGCLLVVLGVAAVIAAAMSLAALIDPFDWYPSFETLWESCDDDYGTDVDECSYEHRFPGFWWHTAANLAYALATGVALLAFGATVMDLREQRVARLSGAAAFATYEEARASLAASASAVALLAALPIVVALA